MVQIPLNSDRGTPQWLGNALVTAVLLALLAAGGAWANGVNARLHDLEQVDAQSVRDRAALLNEMQEHTAQMAELKRMVAEMDAKLDGVIVAMAVLDPEVGAQIHKRLPQLKQQRAPWLRRRRPVLRLVTR